MEFPKSMQMKVGTFVLVGVVLFVGFVMALGGTKSIFSSNYSLIIKSDDTMGLAVGSAVLVAGVPCGNVLEINFLPGSPDMDIVLTIEKRFQPRITSGSTITVATQGALGDKYVAIKPGPINKPPLQDKDYIEKSNQSDIFTTLGNAGDKFEKVLSNVDSMVQVMKDKDFGTSIAQSMLNVKKATEAMDKVTQSLQESIGKDNNFKKSLDHMASILEKIDSGHGSLGGIVNDPTIHEDLKSLLGGAKRSKLLKYLIRSTIQKSEDEQTSSSN